MGEEMSSKSRKDHGVPRPPTTTDGHAQDQTTKNKSPATSVNSQVTSNWLPWGSKPNPANNVREEQIDFDDDDEGENDQNNVEDAADDANENVSKNNFEINNGGTADDENPDTESEVNKRKKSWSFWSAAEDPKEKNAAVTHLRATNTIVTSTSLLSKDEASLKNDSKNKTIEEEGSRQQKEKKQDDAILYKPHDSAQEFRKINTHKNENLTGNVIVPTWETCLRIQSSTNSSTTSSEFNSSIGAKSSQTFDIKYWRNYLSNISSRLGLTSASDRNDTKTADDGSNTESGNGPPNIESELNLLKQRSYKLYGRALSRLPPQKRACLPNLNKTYSAQDGNITSKKQYLQSQNEEQDPNDISITNDAMGNILINYDENSRNVSQSNIVSQKVGPLQKIKKILIIGVHGFFPTKMVRPIIGSPKGTSLKFANEAEKAVIRYFVENGTSNDIDASDISVQKIALEKEGKIFDRVDFFLKILTKWKSELNEADFVFFAAHSQGCVVSIILLSRLIKLGVLENPIYKRIGILGMAGVNNGPFYGIDKTFFMKAYSAIEHDSLYELFELNNFESRQSKAYKNAMQTIINMNVKFCLVGSINDQLVPLYSALASHIFHPNIYRACYIDHASKTPKFIRNLISICCQLQNTGYFDNDVIKEISPILAGPFTGGGHSRIYNDGKVYDLGLKFFLDTDDMVIPRTVDEIQKVGGCDLDGELESPIPFTNQIYVKEYSISKIGTNPYILPWCLRGLIFNVEKNWKGVQNPISFEPGAALKSGVDEINELYELFDQWQPDTKALKDLKFRLNGIRGSKL